VDLIDDRIRRQMAVRARVELGHEIDQQRARRFGRVGLRGAAVAACTFPKKKQMGSDAVWSDAVQSRAKQTHKPRVKTRQCDAVIAFSHCGT
jgi:hypothetical protein